MTPPATELEQLGILLDRCAYELVIAKKDNPGTLPELRRDAEEILELVRELFRRRGLDAASVPEVTEDQDVEALAVVLRGMAGELFRMDGAKIVRLSGMRPRPEDAGNTLLGDLSEHDPEQAASIMREMAGDMFFELSWGRKVSDDDRTAAEGMLRDAHAWLVAVGDARAGELPPNEDLASDLDLASALLQAAILLDPKGE